MEEIRNKVKESGLVQLDLASYKPKQLLVGIDLSAQLWQGLVLKEKDFREWIKTHNWAQYTGHSVYIYCSTDAIIPTWAYMLLALKLSPFANAVVYGNLEQLEDKLYYDAIAKINPLDYADARVVVKGCSKVPVPTSAYVEITQKLIPHVKSLMFGEPCSTVPLYKKK